ncbi:hypothetical protein BRC79_03920 [Halobacteriales archaeon QH_8_67_27]|nr:MAG: hypothetical protein BRC79_03920 [Halobacteriales archaeon QH_8_67_27]
MTDGGRSRPGARVSRRGLLALGGATLLAGCGFVSDSFGDEEPVELDSATLAEVVAAEGPDVTGPLPVTVDDDHVAASRDRARSALSSVPLPLSAEELPNGAMRTEVHDEADHARAHLSEAEGAPGTRERLELLARARGPARSVEATWAFANGELSAADVESARESVQTDIRQFRTDWNYVGSDPVRAVVVHALVETWTKSARNARHVGERFVDSLSDPRPLDATFRDARESLASTVESKMENAPDSDAEPGELVDADVDETVAGYALRELHRSLPYDGVEMRTEGRAETVLRQVDALARIGAFETFRDRVAAGDHRTVESAEDIRTIRSSAVTAIEDALDASRDERLARAVLADLDDYFAYAARELDRQIDTDGETVERHWIARDIALYVQAEYIASATPDACDEGLAALGVE